MKSMDRHMNQEDPVLLPPGDKQLLGWIRDYFKASSDIEDIKCDPEYDKTFEYVKSFFSGFIEEGTGESEIRRFLSDSTPDDGQTARLNPEISRTGGERAHKRIDCITAEWVRDWHERKRREQEGGQSEKDKEITDFVIDSVHKAGGAGEPDEVALIKKDHRRVTAGFRWTAIAAAAALIAFFLIRFFYPADDPERLFSKYYEPYFAVPVITRSSVQLYDKDLGSALENYRNRNYRMAAVEFSKALLTSPVPDMPEFYLGITLIELNEYERAFMILDALSSKPGDFLKDAQWYLGLLSVRTGKTDKARECFESLAGDSGFYSLRAQKILRLLKR